MSIYLGDKKVAPLIVVGDLSEQPQLNAPTISLSGKNIALTNPSTNGNFFSKFKIFSNGVQKAEQAADTFDLSTIIDEYGTYTITAKCSGTNFEDSVASNSVEYVYAAQKTLQYYGTATALSVARSQLSATTVGNYALFGGGNLNKDTLTFTTAVDAYDTSLTHSIPTELSNGRRTLAATTVGNYALFGGGTQKYSDLTTVDAYDTSLTRTIPTALSVAKSMHTATTVGDYALFGGGQNNGKISNIVNAYNTSLTRTIPTALSVARYNLGSATIGNYALFVGGNESTSKYSTAVDAYDTSLTRTIPTQLSSAITYILGATNETYAVFCGDYRGVGYYAYAYDSSLTMSNIQDYKNYALGGAAIRNKNFAIFAYSNGGQIYAYDETLTKTTTTALSVAREYLTATTVGEYILFGGGDTSTASSAVVDVYTVA